jgi:hypothetical protein
MKTIQSKSVFFGGIQINSLFPKSKSREFQQIYAIYIFVANRHAVAAQSAAYSAPEGGMIINHHKSSSSTNKNVSKSMIFLLQKSKSIKKVLQFLRNPYKIKPNENHPKQKCIFWGYPNQFPFPKILRFSDPQIL